VTELVAEVARRLAALPAPKNGQVRAVPDERTIRYYGSLGLLDRPAEMRGRTALYTVRHVAQVIAIKRLQNMGRTLAEIQTLWLSLDDATLAQMSGVTLPKAAPPKPARAAFWKGPPLPGFPGARVPTALAQGPMHESLAPAPYVSPMYVPLAHVREAAPTERPAPTAPVELRIELAPNVSIVLCTESISLSPADVRAIRAAAAPLVAELASRRLAPNAGEKP
jgi:DNA-binding transcriptional MerR regulator